MKNGASLEVLRELFVQSLDDREEQSQGKSPSVMIPGLEISLQGCIASEV